MNEIEELEDILDSILRGVQEALQAGEVLSDEFQAQIANEINELTGEIDRLYAIEGEVQQEAETRLGQQPLPQGADLLWILSGGDQNAFVNYLRTYPGQGFQELAADPARLAQVIANFQRNNPINPQPSPDGIDNTQFPSSNVAGMKYDPRSGKLLVKFHGKDREPIYEYSAVPPQIFNLLQHGNAFAQTKGKNQWGEWWPMKNPSIGAAVNQYLKAGGYQYQRLR